jgi:hypothetical protein
MASCAPLLLPTSRQEGLRSSNTQQQTTNNKTKAIKYRNLLDFEEKWTLFAQSQRCTRALGFGEAGGPVGPGRVPVCVCVSHQPAAERCRKASILQNNYTKPGTTGLRAPALRRAGRSTYIFFLQLRWLAADPTSMAIPAGGAPLQACTMSEADDGLCCSAFWIIFAAKGNRIHIDTIGQQCYGWHGFCHQMCPQGVPTIQSEGIMKYIKRLMCVTLDPFVHKACRWAHVPLLTHQHDKYNR